MRKTEAYSGTQRVGTEHSRANFQQTNEKILNGTFLEPACLISFQVGRSYAYYEATSSNGRPEGVLESLGKFKQAP
jgi:hypothetical protein